MLDVVYRRTEGEPAFPEGRVPTRDELQGVLLRIIAGLTKMLTRLGHLLEDDGMTCIAGMDTDNLLLTF